jgi:hypothetical protein
MAIVTRIQQLVAIRVYWLFNRVVVRFSMADIWTSDLFDASLQTFASVLVCAYVTWV